MNENNQPPVNKPIPPGAAGSGKRDQKRKPNPQRAKAMSAFESPKTKGLVQIDSDFLGFSQESRNNTMVDFDPTLQNRFAENYVAKAMDVASMENLQPAQRDDLMIEAYSMVSLTIARKLFISAPQIENREIDDLKIFNNEFFTCPNLFTAVSNLGKLDFDSYVVRLRYNAQDIFRTVFSTLKVAARHSLLNAYTSIRVTADNDEGFEDLPWAEVLPENLVFNTNASADWIRDQAKLFLKAALKNDVELEIPDGRLIAVSYPYLETDVPRDELVRNIATWLTKLSDVLPDVFVVAKAAFMLVWEKTWFIDLENTMHHLLGIDVPPLFNFTPLELMNQFGVRFVEYRYTGLDGFTGPIQMLERLYEITLMKKSRFDTYLNMVKMPDEKFGSKAQLFSVPTEEHFVQQMPGLNIPIAKLKPEAAATTLFKIDDPALATIGIISGFTTSAEIRPTFKARVVHNINSTRTRVFNGDFIRYNRY